MRTFTITLVVQDGEDVETVKTVRDALLKLLMADAWASEIVEAVKVTREQNKRPAERLMRK